MSFLEPTEARFRLTLHNFGTSYAKSASFQFLNIEVRTYEFAYIAAYMEW